MFGWLFGKKKEKFTYKPKYSVQEDSSMTRWEKHHCVGECQSFTRHKVMRVEKGHRIAIYQCTTCKSSYEAPW